MDRVGHEARLPRRLSDEDAKGLPNLGTHQVTSPKTPDYNCIAFAAGDDTRWWEPASYPWPNYYWPDGATRGVELAALRSCFESLGYETCPHGSVEPGFSKVALFALADGEWTHAARQLADGQWTSKLGRDEDITHPNPESLHGPLYGTVAVYMKRRIR
jgi:hypothetical protein